MYSSFKGRQSAPLLNSDYQKGRGMQERKVNETKGVASDIWVAIAGEGGWPLQERGV